MNTIIFTNPLNSPEKNMIDSKHGRFPANLLVSDDTLNDGNYIKNNDKRKFKVAGNKDSSTFKGVNQGHNTPTYSDSGSFSRYFSLDSWWEQKILELPENARRTFPFLIVPKASKSEKNRGCETLPNKNNHPTVKNIKLMSWLITLGSRKGQTILDPYSGSGTTLIAAKLLEREYIGFELEPEYCQIARARLKAHEPEAQKTLMEE
jgi:site-specific DNA-methyltransferase (adenine-specific)